MTTAMKFWLVAFILFAGAYVVETREATMMAPIAQTQPSTVQSGRCAFGRLARLFYITWNDRDMMRLAATRLMGD